MLVHVYWVYSHVFHQLWVVLKSISSIHVPGLQLAMLYPTSISPCHFSLLLPCSHVPHPTCVSLCFTLSSNTPAMLQCSDNLIKVMPSMEVMVLMVLMGVALLVIIVWLYCETSTTLVITTTAPVTVTTMTTIPAASITIPNNDTTTISSNPSITVDEHDKGELVTPNASITTTATIYPITDDEDDDEKLV